MTEICDGRGLLKKVSSAKLNLIDLELDLGISPVRLKLRPGRTSVDYERLRRLVGKKICIVYSSETGDEIPTLLGVRELKRGKARLSLVCKQHRIREVTEQ